MPPRTRRNRLTPHAVTAVVISHDGAAWLPDCLAGLAAQTCPPQRVVAVDTGSRDDSVRLLSDKLGASAVVNRPRATGLGAAIQAGLEAFSGAPAPSDVDADAAEWIWVLHDDCAPDPDALQTLLARATECPTAAVIGPKVISWDRRVLAEVGLTIDSSGRRETGLERRELDQGQHDDVSDVLAVGTAGMLVRRAVWEELGGLEPMWPIAGDDVDFGWRVNAAGHRVVVAPAAVVRHATALQTGRRKADAATTSYGAAVRGHGMSVVLANTSPWLVLPIALRLMVESLLRAIASLLLLRSPRRARDELFGLVAMVLALPRIAAARRRRAAHRQRPHRDIRALLAPAGWRVRHTVDAVTAVFAGRTAVEERQRRRAPVETGPVAAEAESFATDDLGVLAQFFTRPGVLLTLALAAVALVADRHLLGGALHGGRLLPAAGGASDLWSAYTSSWHAVDLGSTTATSPFIAVLALLATLCFGKVWLAVDILLLGAVPLCGLSAYLSATGITRRVVLRVWAGVAYALLPAVTGAVADGRVDVVIAAILLPPAVRAAAAAVRRAPEPGWASRAVGAGVLVTVAVAAVPALWLAAAPALLAAALVVSARAGILRRAMAALVVAAIPVLLLLPLTITALSRPEAIVAGAGLPETFASHRGLSAAQLVLLHPGGPAQPPQWMWVPVVLVAVVGLASARRAARAGVTLFITGAAAALVVSRLTPTEAVADSRYWVGGLLLFAGAGAVLAATVAVDAAPGALRRAAFGWRQPAVALVVAAGIVGTLATGVVWLARGAESPLTDSSAGVLPIFAQAEAAAATSPRTLVVRSDAKVVHYTLVRSPDGLTLPDADLAAARTDHRAARAALDAAIADTAAGRARAAGELAEFGISQVVVPSDTAGSLRDIAAVEGLARVPATATTVYRAALESGELVLLSGGDATAASAGRLLSPQARLDALDAQPGKAHVTVSPATGGRLLVLSEPRSSAWRATLAGQRLAPVTAYGWAQAWRVPADAAGQLSVSRVSSGRASLLLAQLLLVIVALALTVPVRGVPR